MRRTDGKRALSRTAWAGVGVAAALLLASCEGATTPTEVVAGEPSVSISDVVAQTSSGGPGCIEGCVPGAELISVDDAGTMVYFVPDSAACTTKIVHQRRTMTVELVLPPEVPRPSRNVTLDFASTGWRCPMPGPTWEEVCRVEDWTIRVQPSGRYRATCHMHDF